MAKPILQQLFDGEIYPSENINPSDPKYNEAKMALAKETDYLLKTLSGDNLNRFQKISDLYYETASIYNYECFAHGFRLAITLMFESLNVKDNIKVKPNE